LTILPLSFVTSPNQSKSRAFTLIELALITAIAAVIIALLAPTFGNLKNANDLTNAAYQIKAVLRHARTFARVNNTYAWVGLYEENGAIPSSYPPTPGAGRLIVSSVASTDGSLIYGSASGAIDPTRLMQLGKLLKIDNVHVPLFAIGTGTGATFDTRPALQFDPVAGYNYSRFGELNSPTPHTAPFTNSQYPFQYPIGQPPPAPQYVFSKTLQFSPRGECRINGNNYDVRRIVEIGLLQSHGNALPRATSGSGTSTAIYEGNVVALQIGGLGGSITIYRR
jgi:type II secretory pathway pseudopilin PulG